MLVANALAERLTRFKRPRTSYRRGTVEAA